MNFAELTDEALVELTISGERKAFAELVDRYQPRLLRYGQRFLRRCEDAEDAVQETFIKAYRNLATFKKGQRLSPWIYRIAHNTFVSVIRTRHLEPLPFFDADQLFPHPIAPDRTDHQADTAMIRKQLDAGLNKLEAKYREALILRFFEDCSYSEIADILHLPIGTVSVRLKRGLKKLSQLIPPL